MRRTSLVRSASFRLAALYLALFAASAVVVGAFVYWSIRHEILADFQETIVEERDALRQVFAKQGRDRLSAVLDARAPSGGQLAAGLWGSDGRRLAGDLELPLSTLPLKGGWFDAREAEADEAPEPGPEMLRALATPLSDGSLLIVAGEWRRADKALQRTLTAFAWALAATILLGAVGGLWLSAQFLRRVQVMRHTAHGIMAGDWSRRIPVVAVDDDLSALARTFNRLFERIEKLLMANKHVSADIAHELRRPLSRVLRRLERARLGQGDPSAVAQAVEEATAEVEGVLETFDALLRIGQIEAGARRAAFQALDVAEVARDVVEAFRPTAEEQGRTFVARLDQPLPLQGDRELLTQMIANCLDNALTHTQAGVGLAIEGKVGPAGPILSIADNGPGVSSSELAKLFQPFFRGDGSPRSAGSGLGLSLVAAIAELHGLRYTASDNLPGLRITFEASSSTID